MQLQIISNKIIQMNTYSPSVIPFLYEKAIKARPIALYKQMEPIIKNSKAICMNITLSHNL